MKKPLHVFLDSSMKKSSTMTDGHLRWRFLFEKMKREKRSGTIYASYTLEENHPDRVVIRIGPPVDGKQSYPMKYDHKLDRPFFQIPMADLGLPPLPNAQFISEKVDKKTGVIHITISKGIQ